MKFKKGQNGFTLIELLIVIAVLGILAAITIPSIIGITTSAKVGAANAELASVQTAAQAYVADNNGYPSDSTSLTNYLSGVPLKVIYNISLTGLVTPQSYIDDNTPISYDGTNIYWDGTNHKWIKHN
jgi:prepilin-type N-terminal cleavage/methylation domain-containing protein